MKPRSFWVINRSHLADFGPGFQNAVKSAYPGWSVVRHTATSKIRLRVRRGERCVGEQAVLPLFPEVEVIPAIPVIAIDDPQRSLNQRPVKPLRPLLLKNGHVWSAARPSQPTLVSARRSTAVGSARTRQIKAHGQLPYATAIAVAEKNRL